ncbi:insulin-like growth factor 2 mRNA-binding protein 1 isoform X2 [Parasteatoda tepidariorum]|uniref:insulin-like growth factor 2 mRNA-binding protein 1 isoform X2 n=1 Tax=Parasteatoda tepidariorum TaxID=114398 RepID=UPI00077FDAE4|nr:insulin-like growth factor 2 mRNA-binding protein 1 isoform X2 [Parasteatoda tepidariorum]
MSGSISKGGLKIKDDKASFFPWLNSNKKVSVLYIPGLLWEHESFLCDSSLFSALSFEIMGSQLLVEPSLNQNRRNRSNAIHISNIPEQYQWDEFVGFLSNLCDFQECEKGGSKQNTYNAIVTYENQEEAQQALQQLNNYQLQPGTFLKAEYLMDAGRGRGGPRGRAGSRPFNNSGMYRSNDFPLRILVLSDMVGAIIGRAGGTIRQITQQSRARVDVHRKENAGSPEKVITIYGTPDNCSTACQKIMEIMQQEANTTNRGEIPLKILAHNNLIGRIIGKNGSTIKRIMEQTETKVAVSSNIHDVSSFNLERVITVKGKLENMSKSERMISSKLRQSYENDLAAMASQTYMYPGVHPMAMMSTTCAPGIVPPPRGSPPGGSYGMYGPPPCMPLGYNQSSLPPSFDLQKETVYIYVPSTAVGAIIGTGGSTIRDMISSSGASIKVIQPGKDEPLEKQSERKVCIIGTSDSQWKAQFMIFKKVGFEGYPGPQEATLKVEMFVPTNQVGRIIGKGGQTVRDLQRVTHALIKFPEDARTQESDETSVHIIGDFYCTQAAQRQIRALVYKSNGFQPQQQPRRRMSQPTLQTVTK